MNIDLRVAVKGKTVDGHTRCIHYHSHLDIIAIRFRCCNEYYPCYFCHQETVSHAAERWPVNEFNATAVLCGACGGTLTIQQYKSAQYKCPHCQAAFNPACINHDHLYFEPE